MSDDDFKICDDLACSLFERYGDEFTKAIEKSNTNEKIVVRIWHFFGIVGGGGFEEVFSQDVFGSAGYKAVEQDFREIGAGHVADLVSRAVLVNNTMINCNRNERRQYQRQLTELDHDFYKYNDAVVRLLARFIRAHF